MAWAWRRPNARMGGRGLEAGGGDDEVREAVRRLGCEGALILCYQMESEHDCYRLLESECEEERGNSGGGRGDEGEDTADCEPGPMMY